MNLINTDSNKWNEFIIRNKKSNIFHSLEWESLLRREYGFDIRRIGIAGRNDNIIIGGQFCFQKKKIVALPFSDYYELITDDSEKANNLISDFLLALIDETGKEIMLKSFIHDKRFVNHQEAVIHFGYYNESFEEIYKNFDDMHKRGVRKALKSGLVIKIDRSLEGIKKYFELHLLTRKKQGVPIQPYSFFQNLFNEVIQKGLGLVSLIYFGEKVIAGGVFLHFNNTFTYKFGASDSRYLNYRPNNLMFYEMIKYAVENGFTIFDFGKTDLKNEGLRKFKSGWGAIETPLYYSYYPEYKPSKVFNFLKDKIVAPVIRYSPKFVCRGIGEVFYKYSV